jgi:rhodanese-related sulfurtransferase
MDSPKLLNGNNIELGDGVFPAFRCDRLTTSYRTGLGQVLAEYTMGPAGRGVFERGIGFATLAAQAGVRAGSKGFEAWERELEAIVRACHKEQKAMNTITALELKQMRDRGEDFLLINSLPAEMFAETKIPGAVSIPQEDDDFVKRVEQRAGGKEKPIVVYCMSETCDSSQKAAEKLEAAGFEDVWKFPGGAEGWKEFVNAKKGAAVRR